MDQPRVAPRISSVNAAWLRQRGTGPDEKLEDLTGLSDIAIAARHLPSVLLEVIFDSIGDYHQLRRTRSGPQGIGALASDIDSILSSTFLFRPLLLAVSLGLLGSSVATLLQFPLGATVLLGLACFLIGDGRRKTILAILLLVVVLVLHPHGWVWTLTTAHMAFMALLTRRLNIAAGSGPLGSGLGFFPLRSVAELLLRGAWGNLALGIDKAQGDDCARAELFLAAAEPRCGKFQAVIQHARAVAQARSGNTTEALTLIADRAGQDKLPAAVRGWCSLMLSEILARAAQFEAAAAELEKAIPALATRRARGVRLTAQLRLVELLIDQGSLDRALSLLTEIRAQAVARRHFELMCTTEGHLVQMMMSVGNRAGAVRTIKQISPSDSHRSRATEPGRITTMWSLLNAQLALEGGELSEAQQHAELAHDRAALQFDVSLKALASLVLAEVLCSQHGAREALPHVLAAIDSLQKVRYGLPAPTWRRKWMRINARAFELALEVSGQLDDPYLVAETIENIRAQALPTPLSKTPADLESLIAALLDQRAQDPDRPSEPDKDLRSADLAYAATGVLPLHPPASTLIKGASWIAPSSQAIADIDQLIIDTVGNQGWYWSACLAAGSYWWTVRHPDSTWTWGSQSMSHDSPGWQTLRDLLDALPLRQPEETDDQFYTRMDGSPLVLATMPEATNALLLQGGQTFLPPPLRKTLASLRANETLRVLVSLNGPLSALPVNALFVDDSKQVIDAALVSYISAPALIASLDWDRPTAIQPSPVSLAIVDPSLRNAKALPETTKVLYLPTTTETVLDALHNADPLGLFCAFTHHTPPHADNPASGGVRLTDGTLTLGTLLSSFNTPVKTPERVLLAMCESLAAGASVNAGSDAPLDVASTAHEWLGLASGFLISGTRHLVATAWLLPDYPLTTEFDHAIARALVQPQPAAAVRNAILELVPVGEGRKGIPVILWAAYTYLGPLASRES